MKEEFVPRLVQIHVLSGIPNKESSALVKSRSMGVGGLLFWMSMVGFIALSGTASAQNASFHAGPYPLYPYTARAVIVNPDQGKMGIYRSLAELAWEAYESNNYAQAAVLARILERVWDRSQGDLRKSSPEVWSAIDKSMDKFIGPLIVYASTGEVLPVGTEAANYQRYLRELDAAD